MARAPTPPDARSVADRPPGLACSIKGFCPFRVLVFLGTIALFAIAAALNSHGAEADRGQRLAQSHCASCHGIAPPMRSEVATAPPFDVIGRKYGFNADAIVHAIAGPHPKMNFSPRPARAADIAAYIATLGR
jgi:mono/diheme cytochrome c family protein